MSGLILTFSCAMSANKCLTFNQFCEIIFEVMRDKIIVSDRLMSDRVDSELAVLREHIKRFKEGVTFKCWNCDEERPIKDKKDWGFNEVCPECDLYLFDEAEKREKRRF